MKKGKILRTLAIAGTCLCAPLLLSGCTNLTYHEQQEITRLKYQGVSIDRPTGQWEKPASPLIAGALNILIIHQLKSSSFLVEGLLLSIS